jgi:hypothetical protein
VADDTSPETEKRSVWQVARLVAATLVAIALLAYVIGSTYWGPLSSCHQQVAPNGAVVTTCGAVGVSDAAVVVAVLLVVLLLLPDFAEVAIPGLISLKRRVAAQEERQQRLEQRFQSFAVASANPTTHIHLEPFLAPQGALEDRAAEAQDKRDALAAGEDTELVPPQPEVPADPESQQLAFGLLALWERLWIAEQEASSLAAKAQASGVTAYGPSFQVTPRTEALLRWYRAFASELTYIRAARNAVAHAQPIDKHTLRTALDLAGTVEEALREIESEQPALTTARGVAAREFEERVVEWLEQQGVVIESRRSGAAPGVVGVQDGIRVVAEIKMASRTLDRNRLRRWIEQTEKAAISPDGTNTRSMLVFTAPNVPPQTHQYATTQNRVEIYRETQPGHFEKLGPTV